MKGIRGAITVGEDNEEEIWQGARILLSQIMRRNSIKTEDIGACIFSMTRDLTAGFPAKGARQLEGFEYVPLFDVQQAEVDEALDHCIRVLLLVDTELSQSEIQHVYMGRAQALRPDLRKNEHKSPEKAENNK